MRQPVEQGRGHAMELQLRHGGQNLGSFRRRFFLSCLTVTIVPSISTIS
jgi:hypothetical protein